MCVYVHCTPSVWPHFSSFFYFYSIWFLSKHHLIAIAARPHGRLYPTWQWHYVHSHAGRVAFRMSGRLLITEHRPAESRIPHRTKMLVHVCLCVRRIPRPPDSSLQHNQTVALPSIRWQIIGEEPREMATKKRFISVVHVIFGEQRQKRNAQLDRMLLALAVYLFFSHSDRVLLLLLLLFVQYFIKPIHT